MRGPAIEGSAAEAAREAPPGGKGTSEQDRKYTTQPGANCRQTLPWQGPWKGLTQCTKHEPQNMNHFGTRGGWSGAKTVEGRRGAAAG